ncbi:hypothetical protein MNBD_NITROSPINAE04-2203 [hydrothermal vent metagenome]|uniref:Histidine kinase n=1 Tax=hydrothermal vent metagenome TaxID=652676 RepID=A0A3B1CG68_9ZZZZ
MTGENKNENRSDKELIELRDRVFALEKENKDLVNSLEKLRKAGEIPSQLVNLSFDSFFVHVNNEIKFINETGVKLFGASVSEQIVGKDLIEFLHPDFRKSVINKQKKLYEGGEKGSSLGETRLLRVDGEPVDVEAAGVICDYQGEKAVLVVLRDISKRKRAEDKVKLMALFGELNPAPVLRCGLDGVVQIANPASREIFKTGIVGEPLTSVLPGIDEKEIIECIRNSAIVSFSTFIGQRAFQFTIKGSKEAGVAQIYGSDITNRKLMEDELRHAKEQAEEATKLKDQFVSLVAHDLRSPFSSIIGLLRMLDSGAGHSLSDSQKNIVERVLKSGENLITMIDQLLDISRLKTGKITLDSRFLDGQAIASMVIDEVKSLAEKKSIKIINDVPDKIRLYADFDLFSEVLRNLLSNAIKFCGEGDIVTLFTPSQSKATISVKDTGVGVSEPILSDIFKHEIKTSTRGTLGETGTGLGLPFSHDIIKAHCGSLTVESVEGGGAVFHASVPEVCPRVLIASDELNDRLLMKQYLGGLNVDIVEAQSGEEAVACLEKDLPHLIISEMVMPGMGGLKLLEQVKTNLRTKSIPVIMVASGSDIQNREKAFQLKADDFMVKPLQREDFIPRVRRFVG